MITNGVSDSTIPQSNMINLLKFVTWGLFKYYKKLFTQIDVVSIGNSLAPTIANYFIGTLEEKNLLNIEDVSNPVLYLRNVNDIFYIFLKNVSLKNLCRKLNMLHILRKFKYELDGNELQFLDKLKREK